MTEKEIAKDILLKLIDSNAICLHQSTNTNSADEISAKNKENVQAVCVAYRTILKAVTQSEA